MTTTNDAANAPQYARIRQAPRRCRRRGPARAEPLGCSTPTTRAAAPSLIRAKPPLPLKGTRAPTIPALCANVNALLGGSGAKGSVLDPNGLQAKGRLDERNLYNREAILSSGTAPTQRAC